MYQALHIKVFFAKEPLGAICIYETSKLALLSKNNNPSSVIRWYTIWAEVLGVSGISVNLKSIDNITS